MTEDTEIFGHWLAGFVDGEGHFAIKRHRGKYGCCAFVVGLRSDDREILEEIQAFLGVGNIYDKAGGYTVGSPNPVSSLQVQSKTGVLRVREIFTQFPLRAKKAADFELWSLAVDAWCAGDQVQVERYKQELSLLRGYDLDEDPVLEVVADWSQPPLFAPV